MKKNKSLKLEMAAAVLTSGIMASGVPAFAQDSEPTSLPVSATTEVEIQSSTDYYNPQIPDEAVFGLLFLILLGSGYSAYRKMDGTALRTLAIAAGFTAVMNPETINEDRRILPTIIPVYLDKSPSLVDRGLYVEEAFERLEKQLALLGPVDIRRIEFGEDAASEARPGTHIQHVIQTQMTSLPHDQIGTSFIITDGVLSDPMGSLSEDFSAPVHALIAGQSDEEDFSIQIETAPKIGLIDEEQIITFKVVDGKGRVGSNLTADVSIYYGGENVRKINVPLDQLQEIKLSDLHAAGLRLGDNVIDLRIDTINGIPGDVQEVSLINNHATFNIEGIASETKILLLTGAPHAGTRLWRDILLKDESVSLTHFGVLIPPAKEDVTPLRDLATVVFPVQEIIREKLPEFDVVIMDNMTFTGVISIRDFPYFNSFVENGKGLIVVGGESLVAPTSLAKTSLGELLPLIPAETVINKSYTPSIPPEALPHPIARILNSGRKAESWGPWYSLAQSVQRPDATVLMNGADNGPLLAFSEEGEGRVIQLNSTNAALWSKNHKGGGPASDLYQAMIGWAAGHPRYEAEYLDLRSNGNTITVRLQTMQDTPSDIILSGPDGKEIATLHPQQIAPGLYGAEIQAAEKGAYYARRADEEAAQAVAVVGFSDPTEMQNLISTTVQMDSLTAPTNGQTIRIVGSEGNLQWPEFANADALNGELNADTGNGQRILPVTLQNKTELIGLKREPLIPYQQVICLLIFVGGLIASFKPKDKGWGKWGASLIKTKNPNTLDLIL